jgi:hypothetical protein
VTQPGGPYPFAVQVGQAPVSTQPAAPAGIDWGAVQANDEANSADLRQLEAERREAAERQAELEAKHGALETAGTQFARGALDALLAPGALVGMAAEGSGELLRNRALRDFGRDLGEASSGKSAAEALAFVFGGGGKAIAKDLAATVIDPETGELKNSSVRQGATREEKLAALDASEHAVRMLDEQEKARPGLTMVSRIAGLAATAIGMGAVSAGSGTLTTIGANVAEGAAGGAQAAYEKSAPLRDVLASAAIGGALSGGITAAASGAQYVVKRNADLARVFGDKFQEFADARAVKSAVGRDPKAWRALSTDPERLARVAERLRAEDVIGKSDEEMLGILFKASERSADDLGKVASHLDDSGIAPDLGQLFAGWDDQIARLRKSGTGSDQGIADALERQVAPFREGLLEGPAKLSPESLKKGVAERADALRRSATNPVQRAESEAIAAQAEKIAKRLDAVDLQGMKRELNPGELLGIRRQLRDAFSDETFAELATQPKYRTPSFSELRELKTRLGKAQRWHQKNRTIEADEMQKLYGTTAQSLDAAADRAGPQWASEWKTANDAYSDLRLVSDALEEEIGKKARNRYISMSDYQTGVGGGIVSAIMGADPIGALAMGAVSAIGHKALREGGSAILSSLANRFARMSTRVAARGVGEETKQVLGMIAKSNAFIKDTVARAGDNPALQQAAEETARRVAAEQIAKKAGPFVAEQWAAKPLSAMQKLVYRGQILDQVATDISAAAKATEQLRPAMPAKLDVGRLARLTKDADGTNAIAQVKMTLGELAGLAPQTPTGDAAGVALRSAMLDLGRSNTAESMARAHRLVGWMDDAARVAPDEISKNYAMRASQQIRDKIGSEDFGEAGRLYKQLTMPPHDAMRAAADKEALRESLRKYDQSGHLPAIIQRHNQDLADSYSARFKLSGEAVPKELGQQMKRLGKLFGDAERAVTVDGKGIGKVFDTANAAGVYEGRESYLQEDSVSERTVADAVEPEIEKIIEIVKESANLGAGEAGPSNYLDNAARAAHRVLSRVERKAPQTLEEQRAEYDQRKEKLARLVTNPAELTKLDVHTSAAPDVAQKMTQLLADMPKPNPSIRGKAFETMSSEDIRLANSMWEATTEPLSVFADFAGGAVDYDKVQYAWKQYPGLQRAAQAGVMDILTNDLNDDERARLPDSILTQLDYLLGFQGTLQPTLDRGFAERMNALYQPAPNKPQPGGMLASPGAEPTFTERIAGVAQ